MPPISCHKDTVIVYATDRHVCRSAVCGQHHHISLDIYNQSGIEI